MIAKYIPKLGMPYMGNKRTLAKPLIDFMIQNHGKVYGKTPKYFIDGFGGGGSMSFEALQRREFKQVTYNEFNVGVVALLRDIIENGVTDKYFQWVDRETFNKNKNKDTWFGGFCKVVWSFGNNQKDYLFGKHIEKDKRLLHEVIVNKCESSLNVINSKFGLNLTIHDPASLFDEESMTTRRLRVVSFINKESQRPIHLERVQQLLNIQQLKLINGSYLDIKITTPVDETIIYFDPPYKGTKKYENDIDHNALKKYIQDSEYTIYVSGYDNVYDLKEVFSLKHRSSLSATNNSKDVIERLFT